MRYALPIGRLIGFPSALGLACAAALLAACGPATVSSDAAGAPPDLAGAQGSVDLAVSTVADAAAEDAAPPDEDAGPVACPRLPQPASRLRHVVLSRPYDVNGKKSDAWEVFTLSAQGTLSATGSRFRMGRAFDGEVAFTPDGAIGLVAQEDGSIGVFRMAGDGTPVVVAAAFKGSFYATGVVADPDGEHAWVLEGNWREHGGGLYRLRLACDGTPTDEGLQIPARIPAAMLFLPGQPRRAVVAARDLLDSSGQNGKFDDVHLVDLAAAPPARLASADGFPDDEDEQIVSAAAISPDGRHVLVGDNAVFSGIPNRVAVLALDPGGISHVQTLPVDDPVSILVSPFGDAALVVNGAGNALLALDYEPAAAEPLTLRGPIAYAGGVPELPGSAAMVQVGPLKGRVLIAEVGGVRQVQFEAGGVVRDLGRYSLGMGSPATVGAIGVQP